MQSTTGETQHSQPLVDDFQTPKQSKLLSQRDYRQCIHQPELGQHECQTEHITNLVVATYGRILTGHTDHQQRCVNPHWNDVVLYQCYFLNEYSKHILKQQQVPNEKYIKYKTFYIFYMIHNF